MENNELSLGYEIVSEYIMNNNGHTTYHGSFYTVSQNLFHMIKHNGMLYYVDEDIEYPLDSDLLLLNKNKFFELKPVHLDLVKETLNVCPLNKFLKMADDIVLEWEWNDINDINDIPDCENA